MPQQDQWNLGDVIVLRGITHNKIWYALPVFVVRDAPGLIALYWPAGTRGKWRMSPSGARVTPRDALFTPLEIIDRTWDRTDVLMLIPPGAAHAVYLMREEGWKNHLCWYVNLQAPVRRVPSGFDTSDHVLDVVLSPDRSNWRWKDEDELEEFVAIGWMTRAEAEAVRKEGHRAIDLIQQNQPPFDAGWEDWSPPDEWGIPALPEGWDRGY